MGLTSAKRRIRTGLPILTLLALAGPAFSSGGDRVFAPGHDDALNALCGQGRTGRTWTLDSAEPAGAGTPGAMTETVVPAAGRTDIVRIMPGAIIPCILVIVATDARGITLYDLAVDAANVNRDFVITDIHTGDVLSFCPRVRSDGVAMRSFAADASPGGINRGHVTGLNAITGNGRSGRSWTLDGTGLSETIVPALGRTDVVRIMPGAIVPCVRVRVATDDGGHTRYELAVDAENVNREFRITDIHSGDWLQLCGAAR